MNLPWVQQIGAVLPWRRTAPFCGPIARNTGHAEWGTGRLPHRIPGDADYQAPLESSCFIHFFFQIQNRICVFGHQKCASDQVKRLICDQFRRRKVCESNIAAADRNGLRRLVDAVEFRLDPSETDALKVKTVVPAFPDHPAPKALVCREQEEDRFVPV